MKMVPETRGEFLKGWRCACGDWIILYKHETRISKIPVLDVWHKDQHHVRTSFEKQEVEETSDYIINGLDKMMKSAGTREVFRHCGWLQS